MLDNYFTDTDVNYIEISKTFNNSEPQLSKKTKFIENILISLKEELDSLSN